nr:ribonuclease H-like domain, reverse transcriptase, RNA-dependent DNA polymerase [Tanacetum cinerariifolium]
MEIELDLINKNNTWALTTLPLNQKAIGLKWVFKKRDAKGNIIKYKARLVAKGYVQEQGIDFDEVFALVARIEIVRLILALVAYHGWQVHHLDVKSAFLHGNLKEEVYVTKPEGFVQQGNSEKVYKLTKALYGLRQAPRAWNKQPTVALSSCESEFIAATGAACQQRFSDSTRQEPVFHGRSKHMDIRYHFIRECVENGHINVEHISGELQRADILTKALPRLKFVTMRQMFGVQDLGRSNDQD